MDTSCQKLLPPPPRRIDAHQPVDRLNEPSAQVVILEKEYLELKSDVGYWRAMHAKALLAATAKYQLIIPQSLRISGAIDGLPTRRFRDLNVQNSLKPFLCQRITVSGFTTISKYSG